MGTSATPSGIAVEERGAGPALLMLHGHPFDRSMWGPQLDGLSTDFRVVAPDLPGYGASPAGSDPMTMRAFADAAVEVLDVLALDTAVAVGLSMGGLVAMELGLHHPDRIAGLVLAATTAAPVTDQERDRRRTAAALAEERGMLPVAAAMVADLFGPEAGRDRDLVLRVFAMMLAAPPGGVAAALRGRLERPPYEQLLGSLPMPTLVVAGEHDAYSPEPVIQQLLAALPAPEVVQMHHSGHLPNLEEPQGFNEAVRDFATRVFAGDA